MSVPKIQAAQSNKNMSTKVAIASAVGAAVGAGARYVVPTKSELSSIFNKDAVDTFVSSAATSARGANRSILKFGAIGAVVAAGLTLLSKAIHNIKSNKESDYSKLGALIDAPDYAVEIMWYGE